MPLPPSIVTPLPIVSVDRLVPVILRRRRRHRSSSYPRIRVLLPESVGWLPWKYTCVLNVSFSQIGWAHDGAAVSEHELVQAEIVLLLAVSRGVECGGAWGGCVVLVCGVCVGVVGLWCRVGVSAHLGIAASPGAPCPPWT